MVGSPFPRRSSSILGSTPSSDTYLPPLLALSQTIVSTTGADATSGASAGAATTSLEERVFSICNIRMNVLNNNLDHHIQIGTK